MKKPRLPKKFVEQCKAVTAKRPKTVIDHILKHGFITTDKLKERTLELQKHLPAYIKELIEKHLEE